jgi:nucleotide-binding universal stress UspA family protein
MIAPVLVALSPESSDRGPVDFAAGVCRFTGAPLVIVAVGQGGDVHESLGSELRDSGVQVTVRAVEHESPAEAVAAVVDELRPGLVVAGSTHRGRLGRVLLGSTGEKIVQGSPSPVVVVPHGHEQPAKGVRTVGAGFTPGAEGREALRAGGRIARAASARLLAVMVLDPKHADEQAGLLAGQHEELGVSEQEASRERFVAEQALRQAIADVAADAEPDILFQDAAGGLEAASHRLDLLVLGSRASGDAGTVTLGGVARKVTAHAACPVLVLPRGDAQQIDALLSGAGTPAVG